MRIKLLLMTLVVSTGSAQSLLQGYVTAPDVTLDSIQVINQNRRTYVLTTELGYFKLTASENDTLQFRHPQFESHLHIVRMSNFDEPIIIKLIPIINQLREVIVNTYILSGNLNTDSKNIIIEEEFKMAPMIIGPDPFMGEGNTTKAAHNSVSPKIESELSGINFILIGKEVAKVLGIRKKPKPKYVPKPDFKEYVSSIIPTKYFEEKLKIEPDELNLFLEYSDAQLHISANLLSPDNLLQLYEYLGKMAAEFHDLKQ